MRQSESMDVLYLSLTPSRVATSVAHLVTVSLLLSQRPSVTLEKTVVSHYTGNGHFYDMNDGL